MATKKNYNYAFVFYDVKEKRVNKVFKVCKKYLSHFQKSVFRGEMSPSKLIRFKKDINKIIDNVIVVFSSFLYDIQEIQPLPN